MNSVMIVGRVVREPDIKNYRVKVAKITLAVERKFGDKDADFIPVTFFGQQAEFAEGWIHKGQKLIVRGHLQQSSYEKNGETRLTLEVVSEEVEFAESKKSQQQTYEPEPAKPQKQARRAPEGFTPVDDEDDDKLPFGPLHTEPPKQPQDDMQARIQRSFDDQEEWDDELPF